VAKSVETMKTGALWLNLEFCEPITNGAVGFAPHPQIQNEIQLQDSRNITPSSPRAQAKREADLG